MKKPINNRKKAIIVKKNTAHRYCAIFALILYIAVMLFMIIGYRLTMIGVVGLFPGLVILVLLAGYYMFWRLEIEMDELSLKPFLGRKLSVKWEDLVDVFDSWSYTNHETVTMVFRGNQKIVVPMKCNNADILRKNILSHRSIRSIAHM